MSDAQPIPMLLNCPSCKGRHIDKGEFATKVHATHACQHCGHVWRPAIEPTVGVEFLPGFKDEADPSAEPSALNVAMARMREASGSVTSNDPLVSFLYTLVRDKLTPGEIEGIMLTLGAEQETRFSNGWLTTYCKDIAGRLRLASAAAAADQKPAEATPLFSITFDLTAWKKDGQVYATPTTKVFMDGKQMGCLDRVRLEASAKQVLPIIEIDQKDYPADQIPQGFTNIMALRQRFPWMTLTVLPWEEPATPEAAPEPVEAPEPEAAPEPVEAPEPETPPESQAVPETAHAENAQ